MSEGCCVRQADASVSDMETPRSLVAANIAALRRQQGLGVRGLSERLKQLGHRILPSGITKIEKDGRAVSADDLVALALALQVTPNRLLLPVKQLEDQIALTPEVHTTAAQAWEWVLARKSLEVVLPRFAGETHAAEHDFFQASLPAAEAWRRRQSAVQVADAVGKYIGRLVENLARLHEAQQDDVGDEAVRTRDELLLAINLLPRLLAELQDQVEQAISASALSDEPEYGKAVFASLAVHEQALGRLLAARQHSYLARESAATYEQSHYEKLSRSAQLRTEYINLTRSGDVEGAEQVARALAEADRDVEATEAGRLVASEQIARADQAFERAQTELYQTRRIMLIRSILPPHLPPDLRYIDELNLSDERDDQPTILTRFAKLSARLAETQRRQNIVPGLSPFARVAHRLAGLDKPERID